MASHVMMPVAVSFVLKSAVHDRFLAHYEVEDRPGNVFLAPMICGLVLLVLVLP